MPRLNTFLKKSIFFLSVTFLGINCSHAQGIKFQGDMETVDAVRKYPSGWTYPDNMAKAYSFELDSATKQGGRYSISISNKTGEGSYGSTGLNISKTFKGKEIELRGYLKTENVDGWTGFWLRIDGTQAFDNMQQQNLRGTTDWTEYSIKLPYDDEHAVNIATGALLVGKGKIWLDSVRLFIDGQPINQATTKQIVRPKAELDTAFSKSSGINDIKLTPRQLLNLTMLGQAWGFIKYHHSAVSAGNVNMDAELFRVMPSVLKANDNAALSNALEAWLDRLGTFKPCTTCKPYTGTNATLQPDYGNLFNHTVLSQSLTTKLTNVLNYRDDKKYYISFTQGIHNPVFEHEKSYETIKYPDAGFRLLSLFRYWNMIQYFYPYRHLIGNWNQVLPEFIPQFVNDANAQQYIVTSLALICRIHDTHANIWGAYPELEAFRGKYILPLQAKFVQDKLVVTGYLADSATVSKQFQIGDVITSINGQPIDALIKKYLPLTAASNYQTQLRDMPGLYLLRSNNPDFRVSLQKTHGKSQVLITGAEYANLNWKALANVNSKKPAYKLINQNIGYLYPGKYYNKDLPEIKKLFDGTKGIVVDMRCYPSEFMPFTFVPYIKTGTANFVKFTAGNILAPGLMELGAPLTTPAENKYKGKVVVIVNSVTQSQAEYTTMAFQSSPNVTVIGSTTAGADGNVSAIMLPGGIYTMISGLDVLYPDGTETQQKGVKIDEHVEPTIKGIREGRDELLERAIAIVNGK